MAIDLKGKIELLCGETILLLSGKSMDIPCVETSDVQKLCKAPLVSVHMITYNHESFIRRAIEGVMMQKTNFEFELVIGEDCSQDRTREICFEYQKKYPDKIRVLWWHENVTKTIGSGSNGRRVRAHCRGEFIAFCEGDDCWTDPLKLQHQVDVMRRYPNVSICFGGVDYYQTSTGRISRFKPKNNDIAGIVPGNAFLRYQLFNERVGGKTINSQNMQTSGVLIRASIWRDMCELNEISKWKLLVGDKIFCILMAMKGDVFLMDSAVSQYNINPGGVTRRRFGEVMRDDLVIRLYFCVKALGMSFEDAIRSQEKSVVRNCVYNAASLSSRAQRAYALDVIRGNELLHEFFTRLYSLPLYWLIRLGMMRPGMTRSLTRIYWHLPRF